MDYCFVLQSLGGQAAFDLPCLEALHFLAADYAGAIVLAIKHAITDKLNTMGLRRLNFT